MHSLRSGRLIGGPSVARTAEPNVIGDRPGLSHIIRLDKIIHVDNNVAADGSGHDEPRRHSPGTDFTLGNRVWW
jgi:hypothetical protein